MRKLAFLFLFLASPAFATNYYVDYVGGNDANTPGTTGAPRKTIPATLAAGDVVYLKRGVIYGTGYTFANSGTSRTTGTDGAVGATGLVFTSASSNFTTAGVAAGDLIYINGEGAFTIASKDSTTQLTLSSATTFKSLTSQVFSIYYPITITIDESWGTGSATMGGSFVLSGRSSVSVDGVVDNGILFTGFADRAFYGTGTKTNISIKHIGAVGVGASTAGAIYFGSVTTYVSIDNVFLKNIGVNDGANGDDGIMIISTGSYVTISRSVIDNTQDDGIQLANCDECFVQFTEIKNNVAPTVHADGIQCNTGTGTFDVTFRYNSIHDNANDHMLEGVNLTFYNNLVYRTGTPGNFGIQAGGPLDGLSNVNYYIYNNIFLNSVYAALRFSKVNNVDVRNNIFFDSNSSGSNYAFGSISAPVGTATYDYNIYVRKAYTVDGDTVTLNPTTGAKMTLAAAQAIGSDAHSKKCTAAGCGWTWQSPYLFTSETFASPDFITYDAASPQVDAGVAIASIRAFDYILTPRPQGAAWDIGGYEFDYGSGSADITPAAFSFADNVNVPVNTRICSTMNPAVSAIDNDCSIAISGAGCEYQVNGAGDWLASGDNVVVGDNVVMCRMSDANYSTPRTCTLVLGGTVSDTWNVTTIAAAAVNYVPFPPRMRAHLRQSPGGYTPPADPGYVGHVLCTAAQSISESPYSNNGWTSPEFVYSAGEASVTAGTYDSGDYTYVLKTYACNWSSIPDGAASIDGVEVIINARRGTPAASIVLAQLLNTSRAKVGNNKYSTPTALTTSAADYTAGGAADTWGNALTAAWVKDPDFGVGISIQAGANNAKVYVDSVTMKVWYTP